MLATFSISSLLPARQVAGRLGASKRTAAILETTQLLQGHPAVTNFQGFYNDLLARDRLDTTCLGNGVALPHARTDHVRHLVLALGRSTEGVLFENGQQRIHLIFVIGTPKNQAADYLATVSSLCRLLREPSHREHLLAAEDADAVCRLISTWEQPV